MGCYGLRFRPAGAPEVHVHPQRSALYQSGAKGGRNLLAAWERFWGRILGVGFVEAVLCGGALLVSGPGSRFLRAAPRGILAAARRGEVSLASCSGGCFLRFAPRGLLRWRGVRGALRPLFLLRSCAADQEKRPEKKSGALMACASVRLEHLRDTCIRSASRCISRGQRVEGIFWLRGKEIWGEIVGVGFVELVLCGGALAVCCPQGRPRVP